MAIYEDSDNRHCIALNRADRLRSVTGRELVEVLVPLLVDEFARRRPAAGDAAQSASACACAARSSP
jgi:hypothetical protein